MCNFHRLPRPGWRKPLSKAVISKTTEQFSAFNHLIILKCLDLSQRLPKFIARGYTASYATNSFAFPSARHRSSIFRLTYNLSPARSPALPLQGPQSKPKPPFRLFHGMACPLVLASFPAVSPASSYTQSSSLARPLVTLCCLPCRTAPAYSVIVSFSRRVLRHGVEFFSWFSVQARSVLFFFCCVLAACLCLCGLGDCCGISS